MDQMGFQMPGMATPQLMNPPPPIFGPYGADGLPVQQLPPDLAGHMFSDNVLMEDTNEAKRRRIARVRESPSLLLAGPSECARC